MIQSISELPWLPRPPDDFRRQCKDLDASAEPRGDLIRGLAGHALDLDKLTRLAKSIGRAVEAGDAEPLAPFRLGVIGNGTTELIVPALVASAARYGLVLDVIETPFDQGLQWALDPNSALNTAKPNAVLLAFDHRIFARRTDFGDAGAADEIVESAGRHVFSLRDGLRDNCGAAAIFQTIAPPPESVLGSYDRRLAGSDANLATKFNDRLVDELTDSGDLLLDVAALAGSVGLEHWHDDARWHLAKVPFSLDFVPLYADHVARLLAAMRGLSRKCLVLDLDNTIWGGVIGDDGLDGIVLGNGDPAGEAYLAVQRTALELKRHGVVLAVSSKNEDAIARQPFREHPDMLLREDDIAVFQANWDDKPSNLLAIAGTLNIGVDSLVLLDDNPAERALVRRELPTVAVPELPGDPALYRRFILNAGYFEAVTFSDEDRRRVTDYQANARRVELSNRIRNLDEFLSSLDIEVTVSPFDRAGRPRIAQLINKSNQFNLTTRRYTEAEVAAMEEDPSVFTMQVRLRDSFGDAGMISVVICRDGGTDRNIDTWLMSCRVLGRRVEEAVLAELVHHARDAGADRLVGQFIPSGRNDLVRDHYQKLGFAPIGEHDRTTDWALDLDGYHEPDLPMTVERRFEMQAA